MTSRARCVAAERRKVVAQGVSPGYAAIRDLAPEERKKRSPIGRGTFTPREMCSPRTGSVNFPSLTRGFTLAPLRGSATVRCKLFYEVLRQCDHVDLHQNIFG